MHCGKELGYILADDTPQPINLFATFEALTWLEYEINIHTALVLVMAVVISHAFW